MLLVQRLIVKVLTHCVQNIDVSNFEHSSGTDLQAILRIPTFKFVFLKMQVFTKTSVHENAKCGTVQGLIHVCNFFFSTLAHGPFCPSA